MKKYDVIVAGGGVAGICAAIAASRCGKKTLLIEKQILLGGLATLGRIHWLEPYCDGLGRKILGGLADEFFQRAIACGYQNIPDGWQSGNGRLASWFSPEAMMLALPQWLEEEKVELLLDAQVIAAERTEKRIRSITIAHLGGTEKIEADAFVDATGSAQIFFLADLPCVEGENYHTMIGDTVRRENLHRALSENTPYLVRGRKNYGASLNGKNQPENLPPCAVSDGWQETEWILQAQRLMREKLAEENPKEREIISLPAIAQIRMLRRMVGDATFRAAPDENTENTIGMIPDFLQKKNVYVLPFGSLYHPDCENLYAAGRCISAEGMGWHVSRVIGPCCLTGQAAGLAAAFRRDFAQVQKALKKSGVMLKTE